MFGESNSESPRVPSPWDSFTSTPSSHPQSDGIQGIPKLVPEAEEGNVEYKLQLLSPSPARFARLVTQLKWRLLEGGGQAYYELGVADSGTLIGLPRQQLEESLETLEMMAGEIGASVIVVKEIEVPLELSNLAESQLERWDGRRSSRRKDMSTMKRGDESPPTSATGVEPELSNANVTEAEETTYYSPATFPSSPRGESNLAPSRTPPIQLPFDPGLTILAMDLGEDVRGYSDKEAPDDDMDASPDCMTDFSVTLEISTVYKPRPMTKRATHITHFEYTKKNLKKGCTPSKSTHFGHLDVHEPNKAKSQLCRDDRDKLRELKCNSLLIDLPTHHLATPPSHHTIPPSSIDEPSPSNLGTTPIIVVNELNGDVPIPLNIAKEPRLIVEVLVIWRLSLDEAFLDFEGFSLQ